MSLEWTLTILMGASLILALASWRARQPYVPGKPPLIPLGAIQFLALVVILVMLGHLVSLASGRPFVPRGLAQ
ncbi:MAG: hypothetical protein ACOY99_12195 [Pseudomonadota bacterium]